MLSEQVKKMEERLAELEYEMGKIRGTLVVNFCDYPGKPFRDIPKIWESKEDIDGKTTFAMMMEALEFLHKNKSI